MNAATLLSDGFGRVNEVVHATVEGLDDDVLTHRVDDEANTIAWLVWHLVRVQDDHVADVAGTEQVWLGLRWFERFALPFPAREIGYGQGADGVAAVRAPSDLLLGYADAVHVATLRYVGQLADADFERVVDESWDPPVTLAARLVSVLSDDLQHAGQAAYLRGVAERA